MNHSKQIKNHFVLQSRDRIASHLEKLYRVKKKTKVTLYFIAFWEKRLKEIKIDL